MANVNLDNEGRLKVALADAADAAALRAALQCASGPSQVEVPPGPSSVTLDKDNVEDILAVWACNFAWSTEALRLAVKELAPYARQSAAMHSGNTLKAQQRMLNRIKADHAGHGKGP